MTNGSGNQFFSDAVWAVWEPLIEEVRPRGKTPPKELRRTISAIFWRHQNGAKWRSIPAELGPWWLAAQLFIRWSRQGVWDRLLELVQQRGVVLGMTFIDGTNVRAHHKAAGAKKGGPTAKGGICDGRGRAIAFALAPDRHTSCPWLRACSTACQMRQDGSSGTGALPPTPCASASGTWARDPQYHPGEPMRPWPVQPGSTTIATSWRPSGHVSRNGAPSPPVTRKPPAPSSASSASPQQPIGSSSNRP